MKYLLLLNRAEDALPEPGTPAAQAMLREYTAAVQAMAEPPAAERRYIQRRLALSAPPPGDPEP